MLIKMNTRLKMIGIRVGLIDKLALISQHYHCCLFFTDATEKT